MRTRTTAVGVLLLATLTACSSSDGKSNKAAPSAKSTPPATTAAPATPSPSPSQLRAFGDPYTSEEEFDGDVYKATSVVLGYEHDVKAQASAAEEVNADGYVWSALEIKVCAESDGISVSRFPWVLAYADGARVEPSGTTYDDFPKPEYPIEAQVKNGDCVRGKITYAVPGDQKPTKVIYAPDGMPDPVEWDMPRS